MAIWLRLFELYSEKHSVLVQAENDYKIKTFQDKKKKPQLKKITKLRKSTLKKLLGLASHLSKKVKDPKVLTKIYYFEGLNYYLAGKEKLFYKKLKQAEKTARKTKMKRQIYSRLADYHYNKNQLKLAQKYYTKTIKLPKDKWYPKYVYNLAWTYYSFGKVKKAANLIKRSYNYSKKKGYVDYSTQSVDTILLFYANSNRITLGIKFLESRNEKNFEQLLKFLDYVFEHAVKKYSVMVLREFEDLKLTQQQEFTLITREMKVYRGLKKYPDLQKRLKRFSKLKINYKKVPTLELQQFIQDIKVYTGLLQSLVKNFPDKRKGRYSSYIIDNFNLLIELDGDKAIEYDFYSGETFFAVRDYEKAIKFYKKALKRYKITKSKDTAIATKIFDSYFKSLEYLKKKPNYSKLLLESFESYLTLFPNGKRSVLIYESMIAESMKAKKYNGAIKGILRYNNARSKQVKIQQGYVKRLINVFLDKKDIKSMLTLKKLIDNPKLAFSPKDKSDFKTMIDQLELQKSMDQLVSAEDSEKGIKKLNSIFKNPKYSRTVRTAAIVSLLKFYFDNDQMKMLSSKLSSFQKYLTQAELNKETEKIIYYTSKFCEKVMIEECLSNMNFIRTRTPHLFDSTFEEKQFKFLLMNNKYIEAYSLIRKNKLRKDYFKQFMLTGKVDTMISFLNSKESEAFLDSIKPELDELSIKLYMYQKFGIDSGAISKYKRIPYVQNKILEHKKSFTELKSKIPVISVRPPVPETEEGQVSFEQFSAFLDKFVSEFQSVNNEYNNMIANSSNYFSLYIIKQFSKNYEKVIHSYATYVPQTSEEELKNAILGEMNKLVDVLKEKRKELKLVKLRSSVTGSNFSGSNYFLFDKNSAPPLDTDLDNMFLWKE